MYRIKSDFDAFPIATSAYFQFFFYDLNKLRFLPDESYLSQAKMVVSHVLAILHENFTSSHVTGIKKISRKLNLNDFLQINYEF